MSKQVNNLKKYRSLRKSLRKNQTTEEALLWQVLKHKQLGVKFRRQFGVGPYIVDFINLSNKIIVEVDGGYHKQIGAQLNDEKRESFLVQKGYKIIRFDNKEIHYDLDRVIAEIKDVINSKD